MSDLVERVARAIKSAWDAEMTAEAEASGGLMDYEPGPWEEWVPEAKAAIAAMQTDAAPAPTYRHKKRGTLYTVIGEAELQTATRRPAEGDELVIYRGEDGKLWAREHTEFHDGRFKPTDNVDTPCTAPALKPAVEVWQEASDAATDGSVKYQSHADQAAAAVIEADRAAIIAAKDAEIAALKGKLAEDNADLPTIAYFAGSADARDRLAALQAHADALAGALGEVMEWIAGWTPDFTQDAEWPDTREKVSLALRAYEEFRR